MDRRLIEAFALAVLASSFGLLALAVVFVLG